MNAFNTLVGDLGWIDLALLALLGLSVVVGLWRGLVFEIVSLLGWVVAYVIANGFSAAAEPWIPLGTPDSPLRHGIAYGAVFLLVLVACAVLARILRALVSVSPLSFLDRLLGAVFGALRAAVVMIVVATLVAMTPYAHSPAWQASRGALWLAQALHGLKPVLPDSLNRPILPGSQA